MTSPNVARFLAGFNSGFTRKNRAGHVAIRLRCARLVSDTTARGGCATGDSTRRVPRISLLLIDLFRQVIQCPVFEAGPVGGADSARGGRRRSGRSVAGSASASRSQRGPRQVLNNGVRVLPMWVDGKGLSGPPTIYNMCEDRLRDPVAPARDQKARAQAGGLCRT